MGNDNIVTPDDEQWGRGWAKNRKLLRVDPSKVSELLEEIECKAKNRPSLFPLAVRLGTSQSASPIAVYDNVTATCFYA
jgi:hypothetical protein